MAEEGGTAQAESAREAIRPEWAPEGVDLNTPSVARAYDYALGGAHSFAVDREFFRAMEGAIPEARLMFRANRAFMHRAVRFMIEQGISQFLDIGSGIPTVGNVHDVAQRAAPDARVVYVDIDPVAVAHSKMILADNPNAAAIEQDGRNAEAILNHPDTRRLLDFGKPIGLIMAAILHVIPDEDDPHGLVVRFTEPLVPGSYVVISHATRDSRPEDADRAAKVTQQSATPVALRPREDVLRLFSNAGLELIPPGLVWTPEWRPDSDDEVPENPEKLVTYAGVGLKR